MHEGVYREYIDPPRGGVSDSERIIYEAVPGEKVIIKGSEVIRNWERIKDDVWRVKIPDSFFGDFNPYKDVIHGDWFDPKGRIRHTGAVYLNGRWLTEAADLSDILRKPAGTDPLWFAKADDDSATIWAQFKGVNPNRELVEINVRQSVFYPRDTAINYITVSGFILEQAATPWAPPTARQIGLIGTNWSKGWIIENNVIKYSVCSGISLGKYGDQWDNTSQNTANGYVKTIERALKNGWSGRNIGHHIVRNNVISHCEQTGIVGSLGAIFSTISGNSIHDICTKKWLAGAEMAGIKLHAAVDVKIIKNHLFRIDAIGIWLDWMAQGTRVSRNLFNDNSSDLFLEVNHGPFIIDNNIFLSPVAIGISSPGGAYIHNLFAGTVYFNSYDARETPVLRPHGTRVESLHDNPMGDNRFYNNIFAGNSDLRRCDTLKLPSKMDGNVFLKGARPSLKEQNPVVRADFDPGIKLTERPDGFYLKIRLDHDWVSERRRMIITTELLGKTIISGDYYQQPDGGPVRISGDYFSNERDPDNPAPGPVENFKDGMNLFKVY